MFLHHLQFRMAKDLVLPCDESHPNQVVYTIKERARLLDSANMEIKDWSEIAEEIRGVYEEHAGIVILHGTDTLCYTASALSFILENLGKPVSYVNNYVYSQEFLFKLLKTERFNW